MVRISTVKVFNYCLTSQKIMKFMSILKIFYKGFRSLMSRE